MTATATAKKTRRRRRWRSHPRRQFQIIDDAVANHYLLADLSIYYSSSWHGFIVKCDRKFVLICSTYLISLYLLYYENDYPYSITIIIIVAVIVIVIEIVVVAATVVIAVFDVFRPVVGVAVVVNVAIAIGIGVINDTLIKQ